MHVPREPAGGARARTQQGGKLSLNTPALRGRNDVPRTCTTQNPEPPGPHQSLAGRLGYCLHKPLQLLSLLVGFTDVPRGLLSSTRA